MKNSFLIAVVVSIVLFVAFFLLTSFQSPHDLHLKPSENYPRWLMNEKHRTNQTSGITFLREKNNNTLEFLLADDIGKIHRFFISDDTVVSFSEITFNTEVSAYLSVFPKLDFEEITYDKYTGKVYLTIEGNRKDHLQYHGIYRLKFKDEDIFQDSIIDMIKLNFKTEEMFYKNLAPNIGYEGLAVDENHFYLGLEAVINSEGEFSGYTKIRIADKNSLTIIKELSTENLGISTICGLYADKSYSLWGIDRNHKRIFKLLFDEYFNVVDLINFEIKTVIPRYNHFEYVGSLESITVVSDKFIFLVDDPWYEFFIPPAEISGKLDSVTVYNYNQFVPIIHKFVID